MFQIFELRLRWRAALRARLRSSAIGLILVAAGTDASRKPPNQRSRPAAVAASPRNLVATECILIDRESREIV
jgi:hypothetical protein